MTQYRKPSIWSFPLYQEEDQARMGELKATLDQAQRAAKEPDSAARRGDEVPSVDAANKALFDFITEVADRTLEVKWRAIGSRRFRDLRLAHPPRMVPREVEVERALGEDAPTRTAGPTEVVHKDDEGWGVNTDTFIRALLAYDDGEIATIVSPEFTSQKDRERFLDDELSEGELFQFWLQVIEANQGGTISPKVLASRFDATPTSDET